MADLFAQNVTRHREGRPLLNEITPQEWHEAGEGRQPGGTLQ